jgi:hypothetical protein
MSFSAYCQFPGNNSLTIGSSTIIASVTTDDQKLAQVTLKIWDSEKNFDSEFIVEDNFPNDDHSSASLIQIGQETFLVGYTGHDSDSIIRIASFSAHGGKIELLSRWYITLELDVTYVDFSVKNEEWVLVVTRGIDWSPTAIWFNYYSGEYSEPTILIPKSNFQYLDYRLVPDDQRPYMLMLNKNDRTYFVLNEGHPRNFRSGILAGYINMTGIYSLDGDFCASIGSSNWNPSQSLTQILPPGQFRVPWIWDLEVYSNTFAVAYSWSSKLEGAVEGNSELHLNMNGYSIAKYDHGKISYVDICVAGRSLSPRESDYFGGIALHPEDESLCVVSTDLLPKSGNEVSKEKWSIYACRYSEASTRFSEICHGFGLSKIRPRYVKNDIGNHRLYFMKGTYHFWNHYETYVDFFDFGLTGTCTSTSNGFHVDLNFKIGDMSDLDSPIELALSEHLTGNQKYFEWGAGQSTILALQHSDVDVATVDSNYDLLEVLTDYASSIGSKFRTYPVLSEKFTSLEWGYVQSDSGLASAGIEYASPYTHNTDSDLVVIDGRFRVFCFYQVLMRTKKLTTVIWDDYVDRPWYHSVESFIKPEYFVSRAAIFSIEKAQILDRSILNIAAADQR